MTNPRNHGPPTLIYNEAMPFISITRLRIRSIRFMPFFALHTTRSIAQVRKAPGFTGGALLADRSFTFWTMTAWDHHDSMRAYMLNGPHRTAMPHLIHWCDEASVVHWDQAETAPPTWEQADQRMRTAGRASKVKFPSPHHADLTYRTPRLTTGGPIHPAKPPTT